MAAPISPTAFITNSCNLPSSIGSVIVVDIQILQEQKSAIFTSNLLDADVKPRVLHCQVEPNSQCRWRPHAAAIVIKSDMAVIKGLSYISGNRNLAVYRCSRTLTILDEWSANSCPIAIIEGLPVIRAPF